MNRFELARAATTADARELVAEKPGSVIKAGGIDLLDHLKEHLLEPPRVVDIKRIPGLDAIKVEADGSLKIRAIATLAKVAGHEAVRKTHPALARACGEAASPQIRNVATIGGNVLQRPRCWYYRLESYKCVKKGGDVCFAVAGENRYNVIFGGGPAYPPHPSNAAVPLVAYGAAFVLDGPKGPRTVPAADFFVLPEKDPTRENVLQQGEILTEIRVPLPPLRSGGAYLKMERKVGDFATAAVAVQLTLDEGGTCARAGIGLTNVGPTPIKARRAEALLTGRRPDDAAIREAARVAADESDPSEDLRGSVAYKRDLVRVLTIRAIRRALERAGAAH